MNEHTNNADNLHNLDSVDGVNNKSSFGSVDPVDLPMPDPAAANEKARAIYEANHPQDEGDTTLEAGEQASNPSLANLAAGRREVNRAPDRANLATDPNDTGSGGIPAGGVKSGSSIQ